MQSHEPSGKALSAADYDAMWYGLSDFIRYNPGSRHRRRIIRALMSGLPFQSIADIGCGNGELLADLLPSLNPSVRVEATEFSPAQLADNVRRFKTVTFHQLDLQNAALPQSFDLVICSEVIEHLDDQRRAFVNLCSMVSPGGHAIVTVPTGRIFATERHWGHTCHPTEEDLQTWGHQQGLQLKRLINWGFPFFRLTKWATNLNADWSIKNFGTGRYGPLARIAAASLYGLNFLNIPTHRGCQLIALYRRP